MSSRDELMELVQRVIESNPAYDDDAGGGPEMAQDVLAALERAGVELDAPNALLEELQRAVTMLRRQRDDITAAYNRTLIQCESARAAKLEGLVRAMLENDPNELAADGGITVLDVWRKDARAALKAEAV